MKTKNILIDFSQIPIQKVGVGVYASETFKLIVNNDKFNNYFAIIQDDDDELQKVLSGCKIIKVNSKIYRKFLFRLFLEQIYIPFICSKYNINIVHSLHYSFPIFLSKKIKRIVTVHDLTFFIYPELHTFIKRYYFRFFTKLSCILSDQIICVSESTKNDLLKIIPNIKSKIDVVPLAVDIPQYKALNIKEKFNINKKYILFIGTLEPRKNIVRLIKAYSKIEKNNEYQLVIVGKKGWFYDEIFKVVNDLSISEKVIFTGFVTIEEKFSLISQSSIFIYPSLYEGFGLPVLEAISLGIPTITSNISSMPEVVENSAIKVNPYSIDEIKNAINNLINNKDLRDLLSLKGKQQALKFSWKITADKTINVYNSI